MPDETKPSRREILSKAAMGIRTVQDFSVFMKGVMAAAAAGELDARATNAICQTAIVMLRGIKMQLELTGQEDLVLFGTPERPKLKE